MDCSNKVHQSQIKEPNQTNQYERADVLATENEHNQHICIKSNISNIFTRKNIRNFSVPHLHDLLLSPSWNIFFSYSLHFIRMHFDFSFAGRFDRELLIFGRRKKATTGDNNKCLRIVWKRG